MKILWNLRPQTPDKPDIDDFIFSGQDEQPSEK